MSFVPAGPTKVEAKEDPVIACVGCPAKALVKEGGTYYCTHNFNISKIQSNKTALGEVPADVIGNCKGCTLYKQKSEDKVLPVTNSCTHCPLADTAVSVKDCAKCPYLAYDKMLAYAKAQDKNGEVDRSFCQFPNLDFKSIGLRFTPTKRKVIKQSIEAVKAMKKGVKSNG